MDLGRFMHAVGAIRVGEGLGCRGQWVQLRGSFKEVRHRGVYLGIKSQSWCFYMRQDGYQLATRVLLLCKRWTFRVQENLLRSSPGSALSDARFHLLIERIN